MSSQDDDDQCKKCGEKYTSKYDAIYEWCKSCQINNLKQNFTNWTSENEKIDNLIQEMQLEINELDDMIFEWIPYDQFDDIKEIGEGSDKVHLAIWKDGPLDYDKNKNEYTRKQQNKKVVLKLYNLRNIINEFFIDQQDKKYSITYIGEVLRIHGISQYPNTEDYIIVFQDIYCVNCGKIYTNIIKEWCEPCKINYFKENLIRSGNENIDNIIHEMQLKIDYKSDIIFEWIPYNQLSDIQEIGKDDFDIIYSATWKNGPSCYNDREWTRKSNKVVTLKYLYNSQNVIKHLNMIKFNKYSKIYGISQNPDTENYIIIFPIIHCKKCGEPYKCEKDANYEWCRLCQIRNLKQNFTNWTSGNEKIDNLIQEMQLKIDKPDDIIIEWISYNQFNNIEEKITKECSAIWKDGPLNYNKIKNNYIRNKQNTKITLKLYNVTKKFLNVVIEDLNRYCGKIFGISQNPYTKDYNMILQEDYNEICNKCGKYDIDTDCNWCKRCQKNYLKKIFINWTSGNEKIDNYIRKRRNIDSISDRIFEFIPYHQFDDIKEINKNNLYSAIWKNGPLSCHNNKWARESNKKVYLRLHYLQNTNKFLNKISKNDLSIYGISQNQNTKYCIIVSQYINLYCEKCGKEYANYANKIDEWCIYCQVNDLKLDFANWTSGDENIDNLIQKMQLKVKSKSDKLFEWIPYNQFNNIKKINDDNFAKIYSAIWKNDLYYYKYLYEKEQIRRVESRVVLKYSQNITFKKYSPSIYGISQDPITEDYIIVSENKYCEKCDKEYTITNENWCKPCQINDLRENFTNWTSGNIKIDNLIQVVQLNISHPRDIIFEWIPYNHFSNIEEIDRGGFATIYLATWKDGPLSYYGRDTKYVRDKKKIILKQLDDSQNITTEFLNEVKKYSIKKYKEILAIYGISQNPDTKNYIMVLDYAEGGNLYNLVNKHYKKFDWTYNIEALTSIITGLKEIHDNQMVHRDLHTGNILSISADLEILVSMCISDMGLCGKSDNIDKTNIYGVMPYVAPEVLRGNPYTQAADIYSFGMIMYFIATGRQPFYNHAHDEGLALDICNGIRPYINDQEAPKCYIDLMKWCWNTNPDNRPKVTEVYKLIEIFRLNIYREQQDYDIEEQFKKANEYKKSNFLFLEERRQSTIHSQAVYTSRLLNSFTKSLPHSECLECEI
ncbi:Rad53p [Rhizophagus irregularis DAOM 197198w]|uniref:Rad53p n=3 Tax=Rhizophagus irregularis TaxID=588596 RepID=A0A015JPW4_RHIIW|nr:Rad53p [Rhizophagus irregularis DAOM 197198w]